jgi:hypothetical protein
MHTVLIRKPQSKRSLGKPRYRGEDDDGDGKMDFSKIGCEVVSCIDLTSE